MRRLKKVVKHKQQEKEAKGTILVHKRNQQFEKENKLICTIIIITIIITFSKRKWWRQGKRAAQKQGVETTPEASVGRGALLIWVLRESSPNFGNNFRDFFSKESQVHSETPSYIHALEWSPFLQFFFIVVYYCYLLQ